ncbi:MAG: hypothetical protein Q9228_004698 [Teloschistes exilis]
MAEEEKVVKVGVVNELMDQSLSHEGLEFWSEFIKYIHIASARSVEEFRATAQEADDEVREAQGLKPRPWSEIEKESEARSDEFLNEFDEKLDKWKAAWQQAKDKDPDTVEEIEKAAAPDTEKCVKLMRSAVMGYDAMRRREKGLEPRSEEEYKKAWDDFGVWIDQMVEQGAVVEDGDEPEKDNGQKSLYSSEATQSTILRQAMAGDMKTARFDDPKSIVEDAISNNNSWVWEFLAAADFIKPGDRLNLEEADDQERKEKGLEPRPWSEIAKALKLQLYQVINDLEPHNGEDDIKQPGELKPRPIRDYQEYILLKLVVLKDKQWRKEQGLEPRSWEDVRDAFYESARLTLERLDSVHPPAVG